MTSEELISALRDRLPEAIQDQPIRIQIGREVVYRSDGVDKLSNGQIKTLEAILNGKETFPGALNISAGDDRVLRVTKSGVEQTQLQDANLPEVVTSEIQAQVDQQVAEFQERLAERVAQTQSGVEVEQADEIPETSEEIREAAKTRIAEAFEQVVSLPMPEPRFEDDPVLPDEADLESVPSLQELFAQADETGNVYQTPDEIGKYQEELSQAIDEAKSAIDNHEFEFSPPILIEEPPAIVLAHQKVSDRLKEFTDQGSKLVVTIGSQTSTITATQVGYEVFDTGFSDSTPYSTWEELESNQYLVELLQFADAPQSSLEHSIQIVSAEQSEYADSALRIEIAELRQQHEASLQHLEVKQTLDAGGILCYQDENGKEFQLSRSGRGYSLDSIPSDVDQQCYFPNGDRDWNSVVGRAGLAQAIAANRILDAVPVERVQAENTTGSIVVSPAGEMVPIPKVSALAIASWTVEESNAPPSTKEQLHQMFKETAPEAYKAAESAVDLGCEGVNQFGKLAGYLRDRAIADTAVKLIKDRGELETMADGSKQFMYRSEKYDITVKGGNNYTITDRGSGRELMEFTQRGLNLTVRSRSMLIAEQLDFTKASIGAVGLGKDATPIQLESLGNLAPQGTRIEAEKLRATQHLADHKTIVDSVRQAVQQFGKTDGDRTVLDSASSRFKIVSSLKTGLQMFSKDGREEVLRVVQDQVKSRLSQDDMQHLQKSAQALSQLPKQAQKIAQNTAKFVSAER